MKAKIATDLGHPAVAGVASNCERTATRHGGRGLDGYVETVHWRGRLRGHGGERIREDGDEEGGYSSCIHQGRGLSARCCLGNLQRSCRRKPELAPRPAKTGSVCSLAKEDNQVMKTVRDACQLQPNALSIKLSDQIEQLDELPSQPKATAPHSLRRRPSPTACRISLARVSLVWQGRRS